MLKTDFTVDKVVVYLFCMYMLAMTGLYFHMDSRIRILQTIQADSLDMFKKYSEKDTKQQNDIDSLAARMELLKTRLESLDSNINDKFSQISRFIIDTHVSGGKTPSKK